ncbi:MAG TPA: hypothetical protein VJ768_08525 [Anaerolineales bacterium]|nr:hypothetical protein [Anaerolineales bacterium]
MKKLFPVIMIMLLLSLFFASPAFADQGEPVGSCPPSFELHPFMDHSGDPMHQHIGVDQDLNGDGYICMKMLPNDLHLHVDNSLPSP